MASLLARHVSLQAGRVISTTGTRAMSTAAVSPTIKLASGHDMPLFALGTWKAPAGVTASSVEHALKAGYRSIDAANDYNNEHEVGAAMTKCIEDGVLTREELFVQAKLWNANHKPEHVIADLEQSLTDLQVDYLDSYVIHWPQACPSSGLKASTRVDGAHAGPYLENPMFPMDDDGYFSIDTDSHYVETWRAMEKLVDEGKVRSIGISNFNKRQLEEVVGIARHPVSVLQNESHPYLQQKDLVDVCNFNNIAFQAFSPLGSGDTNLAVSASPTGTIPLQDEYVKSLADKYSKSTGQILLRWGVQRGTSVVSKSVTPSRIESNIQIFDFELSAEDMQGFDALNCGWRHLHWRETSHHPDYPFFDELPYGYELEKVTNMAPGQ